MCAVSCVGRGIPRSGREVKGVRSSLSRRRPRSPSTRGEPHAYHRKHASSLASIARGHRCSQHPGARGLRRQPAQAPHYGFRRAAALKRGRSFSASATRRCCRLEGWGQTRLVQRRDFNFYGRGTQKTTSCFRCLRSRVCLRVGRSPLARCRA